MVRALAPARPIIYDEREFLRQQEAMGDERQITRALEKLAKLGGVGTKEFAACISDKKSRTRSRKAGWTAGSSSA